MSEPRDRIEAQDDDTGRDNATSIGDTTNHDSLRSSLILLQRDIDQLERLRQDHRRIQSTLEQLWQQIAQREEQVSRRMGEVMATLVQAPRCAGRVSVPQEGAEQQPALHVRALGRFAVRYDGREISLGSSKKGRAILRYLATQPERRAAKEVLLELFWPDEEPDKASHKLHIAVSSVRQALSQALEAGTNEALAFPLAEAILYEDEHYGLHPALHVGLDADEFAAHVQAGERLEREGCLTEAIAEYRSALDLYRADFLIEDLYADWAIAPRARLEEMYLTMLGRLAHAYLERGRFAECISCCRQILLRDSFREDAYRQIMRCYSRTGERNRALCEFATCAEILRRELGVEPMRETVELYERILRQEKV